MLLTVLGEYVAPDDLEVHRDALVASLMALGYKLDAARQALKRGVAGGWLRSERVGRRSRVALTPETHAMLRAGYPRIYGFGEPWEWDGRWLLVVIRVSEDRRDVRDRLRTQMAWAGFGSLGGGVWISPHVDRAGEVADTLAGSSGAEALAFSARQLDQVGTPGALVGQAWDLPAIADLYHAFIDDFEPVMPATPEESFRDLTVMIHAWRKFPFVDPDLPVQVLPDGWPRNAARTLFHDRHDRWRATAGSYFRSLDE
jgi:phenylacetic acid degradation operon negative regulatory protein